LPIRNFPEHKVSDPSRQDTYIVSLFKTAKFKGVAPTLSGMLQSAFFQEDIDKLPHKNFFQRQLIYSVYLKFTYDLNHNNINTNKINLPHDGLFE